MSLVFKLFRSPSLNISPPPPTTKFFNPPFLGHPPSYFQTNVGTLPNFKRNYHNVKCLICNLKST